MIPFVLLTVIAGVFALSVSKLAVGEWWYPSFSWKIVGILFVLLTIGLNFFYVSLRKLEPVEERIVYAPEVTVTIPEGFTLTQIGQRVREALPHITEADWTMVVGTDSSFETDPFVVSSEKPDEIDLEGYLFPDTYRFFTDATAEDVVHKLLQTMQEKYTSVSGLQDSDLSAHEVLTLASIVEREVTSSEDRARVADIFLRRLGAGMALQADSTVNYVTGKNAPSVSNEDRQIDSPWNTYLYPGLPPGPIASPGLASIKAVLEPKANDFWYFLTDADGVVHYARTNDEHNLNKAKYLR